MFIILLTMSWNDCRHLDDYTLAVGTSEEELINSLFHGNVIDTRLVIDLGHGKGNFISDVQSHGNIIGIDINPKGDKTITQLQASFDYIPLPNYSAYRIISIFAAGLYAPDEAALINNFKEIRRVLRPDGLAIINFLPVTSENVGGYLFHTNEKMSSCIFFVGVSSEHFIYDRIELFKSVGLVETDYSFSSSCQDGFTVCSYLRPG